MWYFLPDKLAPDAPVVIAMHGVKRDGDRYRDEWRPHAEKHRFLLLAPQFTNEQFPGTTHYNDGGIPEKKGRVKSLPEDSSYRFIEPVFREAKKLSGNRSDQFHLYGHSAGGQFVHRFTFFVPDAPVKLAIAANPGWWTMPDLGVAFPYGLKNSPLDEAGLKAALQRPLIVLLGTADNDPDHPELRKTPEAEAQGPHRFARGNNFFQQAQDRAKALGVPLAWKLGTVPGVAHQNSGMSEAAVKWFFEEK